LDVTQINGEIMVVSKFTLFASTKKGKRPSFIRSAKSEMAIPLYERFIKKISELTQLPVKTGKFGADMQIELVNDGPVTIIIDSKNRE
jgi:D-tyrosyl-tRNA(Tyr) deacylase